MLVFFKYIISAGTKKETKTASLGYNNLLLINTFYILLFHHSFKCQLSPEWNEKCLSSSMALGMAKLVCPPLLVQAETSQPLSDGLEWNFDVRDPQMMNPYDFVDPKLFLPFPATSRSTFLTFSELPCELPWQLEHVKLRSEHGKKKNYICLKSAC